MPPSMTGSTTWEIALLTDTVPVCCSAMLVEHSSESDRYEQHRCIKCAHHRGPLFT